MAGMYRDTVEVKMKILVVGGGREHPIMETEAKLKN